MKNKIRTQHVLRHLLHTGLLAASLTVSGNIQAATLAVDLSNTAVTNGTIDGVQFIFDTTQPAGTGVLDPFLRIQRNGNEQGYNTSFNGHPYNIFDNKDPLNFTHALAFSSLTENNGYFDFLLDINENNGSGNLLSLDGLKFFAGSGLDLLSDTTTIVAGDWAGTGTSLWDMDANGDKYVLLDYDRAGSGSGVSDMLLKVPTSLFANVQQSDNIILWSRFGLQDGSDGASDAGFEEWAAITYPPAPDPCLDSTYAQANPGECGGGGGGGGTVPEPGTIALLGLGLLGMGMTRLNKKA